MEINPEQVQIGKLTLWDVQQVARLHYQDRFSLSMVALQYNVTPTTLKRYLKQCGLWKGTEYYKPSTDFGDRTDRIVAASLEGNTLQEIGDKHNITRERVRQILKENGIIQNNNRTKFGFVPNNPLTFRERFWLLVDKQESCWIWKGRMNEFYKGYPSPAVSIPIRYQKLWGCNTRQMLAGRLAFYFTYKRWPNYLRARCKSRKCVNPDHMVEGDLETGKKLDAKKIREIKRCLRAGITQTQTAQMFKISSGMVSRIATGRAWKDVK